MHVSTRSSNPSIQPFDSRAFAANRMKGGFVRGGLYLLRTATMVDLISTAFGVDADNVIGGPSWLDTDRFDVIARAPADSTPEALKLMLRALLAERFSLAVHNDTKPLPMYALTAGKHPLLREAAGSGNTGCRPKSPNGQRAAPGDSSYTTYSCQNVNMAAFAEAVHTVAAAYTGGIPVVDRTGLPGSWDFDLRWTARDRLATAGAEGISFFDAVEKQLGLKLERQQFPTPVIVVDHVNQTPTANSPEVTKRLPAVPTEFEVAAVKPSLKNEPEGGGVMPGGRIDMIGNTMKDFIKFAWNIDDRDDDTLVGGPKWLDVDRFDIVAKASVSQLPTGQLIDVDALRPMMKSLLLDRFKLQVHYGEAPIDVYVLETAMRTPTLAKADPSHRTGCRNTVEPPGTGAPFSRVLTSHFECHNTTMAQLAETLREVGGGYVDHPVIDATGLGGAWDFALSFSPRRAVRATTRRNVDEPSFFAASDPTGAVSLFEALKKQLGLRLRLQKRQMAVLVIDHVEQMPVEN